MSKLLSVCMIVKDEQDVLDRCLSSINNLADEIIIIDTGSTDRTKEIALQYTEQVYDFKWINDFSAARNESLKYATSKWVLVLDADEYVEAIDIPAIREFLYKETPASNTIYGISIFSFIGKSVRTGKITEANVSRLLPNHFDIKFHRPIHEQPCSNEGLPLIIKASPIPVYHTGYLTATITQKDKSARNREIFTQLKKKSGFNSYDYFTIGNEYSVQGDYKKALYYYEKSYKKSEPQTKWHYICVFELIQNYLRVERIHEAWNLLEKESVGRTEYPDYHAMQGMIYEYCGLFDLAKQSFKTALAKSEVIAVSESIFWLVSPTFALELPLTKLISIAMREHNIHDITYYLTKKVHSDPTDYSSLVQLLELTLNYEGEIGVKKFIELLFPQPELKDYYLLFKVFLSLGQSDVVTMYYNLLSNHYVLAPLDDLRYALLCEDRVRFEAILNQIEPDLLDSDTMRVLSMAYLVWKIDIPIPAKLEIDDEESDDQMREAQLFYLDLVNSRFSDDWIEENQKLIFELLTELFQMNKYDVFDQYINQFSHPIIINLFANYFYSKHKYDLAISYYNNVIDSNELSLLSNMNLASLHVNDQLYDDAIPFFEEALKESSHPRQIYIQLLTYCKDEKTKSEYLKQLFNRYPNFRKLPFLQQLF